VETKWLGILVLGRSGNETNPDRLSNLGHDRPFELRYKQYHPTCTGGFVPGRDRTRPRLDRHDDQRQGRARRKRQQQRRDAHVGPLTPVDAVGGCAASPRGWLRPFDSVRPLQRIDRAAEVQAMLQRRRQRRVTTGATDHHTHVVRSVG